MSREWPQCVHAISIWGFGYNFTNYTFRQTLDSSCYTKTYIARGLNFNIYVACLIQGFF